MKIGIPREVFPGEKRVAQTPETVQLLLKLGFDVTVETQAGAGADFPDAQYATAGCTIAATAQEVWETSDIILKVRPPMDHPESGGNESLWLRSDATLICFLWPAQHPDLVEMLRNQGVTSFAMDQVPRITRAQSMDALSSMANIAGYRSVIEAAENFGRFFTGQITAAGKVPPANVLIIGAGVAGLAAIGAARGLGAQVSAFDTRPAVKEQVASMGADYVTLEFTEEGEGTGGYAKQMSEAFMDAERKLFEDMASTTDIIITTALIPGKPAPLLLTEQAVKNMRPGSVVVDLAAEQGGNCALTQADQVVAAHGVKIVGYTDLPSRMAAVASQLYGNNLWHVLKELGGSEQFSIDEDNEVIRGALVTRQNEIKWPPPKVAQPTPPPPSASSAATAAEVAQPAMPKRSPWVGWLGIVVGIVTLCMLGWGSGNQDFLSHLTVFVLACFVGWQLIWNVSPSLHTPLMSVTNAISGIIIIGGILQVGGTTWSPATWLGGIAIAVATINIAGGFLVTQRMLKMFQR